MDVGWTDIVSMEKKMLMMVRDRGHALTIEIDKEEAGAVFKYFIPKLCNRDMIEKLPGINKITEMEQQEYLKHQKRKLVKNYLALLEKYQWTVILYLTGRKLHRK